MWANDSFPKKMWNLIHQNWENLDTFRAADQTEASRQLQNTYLQTGFQYYVFSKERYRSLEREYLSASLSFSLSFSDVSKSIVVTP
jgi:hypothetical protein